MIPSSKSRVAVVGSLNIDYIASVERLPAPGQTVRAVDLRQLFGGKGANQAVAAARQGAQVSLIGCLGSDDNAAGYRQHLLREKIDCSGLLLLKNALTGTALIAVDREAENTIIVAGGANSGLRPSHIRTHAQLIRDAAILLLQLEVPLPAVVEAARVANAAGVPVVLNPSPVRKDIPWAELHLDTLIVNEGEAQMLVGSVSYPKRLRAAMRRKNTQCLLVTRGARPTICVSAEENFEIETFPVKPVDTVGAGDAFAGAYTAWRAAGAPWAEAVRYANAAGALATLKPGAQSAMPTTRATRQLVEPARRAVRFAPTGHHS